MRNDGCLRFAPVAGLVTLCGTHPPRLLLRQTMRSGSTALAADECIRRREG